MAHKQHLIVATYANKSRIIAVVENNRQSIYFYKGLTTINRYLRSDIFSNAPMTAFYCIATCVYKRK